MHDSNRLTKSWRAVIWNVSLPVPFWNCTTPLPGEMSVALTSMAATCQYTDAGPKRPAPRWTVRLAVDTFGSSWLPGLTGSSAHGKRKQAIEQTQKLYAGPNDKQTCLTIDSGYLGEACILECCKTCTGPAPKHWEKSQAQVRSGTCKGKGKPVCQVHECNIISLHQNMS